MLKMANISVNLSGSSINEATGKEIAFFSYGGGCSVEETNFGENCNFQILDTDYFIENQMDVLEDFSSFKKEIKRIVNEIDFENIELKEEQEFFEEEILDE